MACCGAVILLRCIASPRCHVKVSVLAANSNSHKIKRPCFYTMLLFQGDNTTPDEVHKNQKEDRNDELKAFIGFWVELICRGFRLILLFKR